MLECALVSRREFDPRHDLAINFDTIASANIVFGPFLRESNNTNPVIKDRQTIYYYHLYVYLFVLCN